jgi:eukaryotic-like serine/threonine-protein kinase
MARAGERIGDRFVVDAEISSAGMTTVLRGRDERSGRPVALKLYPAAESVERFEREAAVLAALDHPAIVRYVAHGALEGGGRWLATEWIEGETLAAKLTARPLALEEAIRVAQTIAEALGAAHDRGLVHSDVKPANLLLAATSDDHVEARLLDFGVVALADADVRTRTAVSVLVGTPAYMAPEQVRGGEPVDARTDVWGLGCVLYEAIGGRAAFHGEHLQALFAKILFEDPPPLRERRPGVPPELDALIGAMLDKDPALRPASMASVRRSLDRIASAMPASPAPTPSARLTRGEQRLYSVVMAGALGEGEHLGALLAPFGGRVERLADGSAVWLASGAAEATDLAALAARAAIAIKAAFASVPVALATGRGEGTAGASAVGEVLDRAAALLTPGPIRLDGVTAGLLDGQFVVDEAEDGRGAILRAVEDGEAPRTLLGQPTPCVGREREIARLESFFAETVESSRAGVVLVTAAAGTGKSRLRGELVTRLRDRAQVWQGRGDPVKVGSSFGLLAPALRRTAGILDGEPLDVRREKLRLRVRRRVPAAEAGRVAAFLSDIAGAPMPDAEHPELRAARGDAMVMGDQLARAWQGFVEAETAAQPLVVVLDDLQWADPPSVRLVDLMLRTQRDRPLFVLAFARPEVMTQFPGLWSGRSLVTMELAELGRRAAGELVERILDERATPDLVARLVELAGGNAFFLEELIRSVALGEELPDTVLAIVQTRLERLDAESRRLVRAASVFGQSFWAGGLAELTGGSAGVVSRLDLLASAEIVTPRPSSRFPGEREYQFRYALVREAAHAMLTPADAVLGHRLAGLWLEAKGESDPAVLAAHFERGELPERAVVWHRRAAEQALEGNDLAGALASAARGIEAGASDEYGALRLVEAEAYAWRGEHASAVSSAVEAMRWLPEGTDSWYHACFFLADSTSRLGEIDRLEAIADRLLGLAGGPSTPRQTIALARTAHQLILAGRLPRARALLDLAGGAAERLAALPAAAHVADAFAVHALFVGDLGAYLRGKEAVVATFAAAGQSRMACIQRCRLGFACLEIGDYPRAVRELRAAETEALRLDLPQPLALARHNLGLALARTGHLDEAMAAELDAVRAYAAQGDRRLEGASRLYCGLIAEAAGDLDGAEQAMREGLAVVPEGTPIWGLGHAMLAEVHLALGRPDDALREATRAIELLEAQGGSDEGESLVRLVWAEALAAAGEDDRATAARAAAKTRLLQRADKISDPALRRCFLEQVPENARTLR